MLVWIEFGVSTGDEFTNEEGGTRPMKEVV